MATTLAIILGAVVGALLCSAAFLHLLPRLGAAGRAASAALTRAPGLDLAVTWFTIAPPIAAGFFARAYIDSAAAFWLGLLAGVVAQVLSVLIWSRLHELAHPEARRGPRIVKSINRLVGPARNHLAVWWTALAVPLFWIVRVAQWVVYPPLTWLVRLPRYQSRDWVNVSRHKFRGLVGHDLIWCLYCDWMTGVWSLGSEMLRNVESFWCPIRFDSSKKCANCSVDFPDVAGGWVDAGADIADAADLVERRYPGPGGDNSWFGHPARLTVEGRTP